MKRTWTYISNKLMAQLKMSTSLTKILRWIPARTMTTKADHLTKPQRMSRLRTNKLSQSSTGSSSLQPARALSSCIFDRKLPIQKKLTPQDAIVTSARHYADESAEKVAVRESADAMTLICGDSELTFSWLWLRDHCRCDECYTHATNQRYSDDYKKFLSGSLKPVNVVVANNDVSITWSDGHLTSYSSQWLTEHQYPDHRADKHPKFHWNRATMTEAPTVPFEDYIKSDEGFKTALEHLVKYGFVSVSGTPISVDGTQAVAKRIGFVLPTMFGEMWEFTSDIARQDTAYTKMAIGAHTDQTYFTCPAGLQIFHGTHHDGTGGETLLVDGAHVTEQLKQSHPDAMDILTSYTLAHDFLEYEPGPEKKLMNSIRSFGHIIDLHPVTKELLNFRYNKYDRAPLTTLHPDQVEPYYKAYTALTEEVENPDNEFWTRLVPGNVMIVDNWRVLHGRAGFTGKRVLNGCYMTRDDWLSKARCMGIDA